MRPSFSEFSFGFGVSYEIQQALRGLTAAAPIFPSLIEEARLGYDVKFLTFGTSLFLQFKRSDALTRSTAAEWKIFGGPYYRFPIYRLRESKQHNRLVALGRAQPHVYYCAPLFHTITEFNWFYLAGDLLDNTAAIITGNLPLLRDNNQHYMVYNRVMGSRFMSIPEPLGSTLTTKTVIQRVAGLVGEGPVSGLSRIDTGYFQQLLATLESIPTVLHEEPREEFPRLELDRQHVPDLVRAISQRARTMYGMEWFLIVRSPERGKDRRRETPA